MNKSALLLIDLINEIIHPEGKIASCAEYVEKFDVIKRVNALIAKARSHDIPIIFVIVGFSSDYRELLPHSPLFSAAPSNQVLQLGSWGCAIHEKVECQAHDNYLTKHSVSPFYGTTLDLLLRRWGVEKLIVGGVASDMAIQSAVREGHDLGYQMVVCKDCCAARTAEVHTQSIDMLQRLAVVSNVEELTL